MCEVESFICPCCGAKLKIDIIDGYLVVTKDKPEDVGELAEERGYLFGEIKKDE